MKFRRRNPLLGVLLGAGLYHLFNSLRDRLPDNFDDVKDRLGDIYGTASDRASRASDVLLGKESPRLLGKVGALLIGVGVGTGIGLLIAPDSGERTRTQINDKVSEFSDRVRENTEMARGATGT